MKSLKFLTVSMLFASTAVFCEDLLDDVFDSEDAQDKALKKIQPATDMEDAITLIKAYFDIACKRVFSVRLAKDAEFQKNVCEKELQQTSDLTRINQLRKNAVKMQSLKNAAVTSHDDVLVKEKRIYTLKSLGTNAIYKSKKAKFDNVFARLEVLVKKTFDDLNSKSNELSSSSRATASSYIAGTSQIIKTFLQECTALRVSLETAIKPVPVAPVATTTVAAN